MIASDLTWQVKMGRIKTVNSIPNLCLSIEFKAFKGKAFHLYVFFSFSPIIAQREREKGKVTVFPDPFSLEDFDLPANLMTGPDMCEDVCPL